MATRSLPADSAIEQSDKLEQAEKIVKRYSAYSMGLGIIPIPVVDVASVAASQYLMVSKLANLYQVPGTDRRTVARIISRRRISSHACCVWRGQAKLGRSFSENSAASRRYTCCKWRSTPV